MTMLKVPAAMVGRVRAGLHSVLGEAAQEIDLATLESSREVDGELYTEMLARFDRTRALLDAIGWVETAPVVPVQLDLGVHRPALLDALDISLGVADAQVAEAGAVDAERERRGEPPRQQETIRLARELRDFAAVVRAESGQVGSREAEPDRELIALGRAVRGLRAEQKLSVAELAAACNLTPRRIDTIEAGRFDPPYDMLLALADGLGVGAVRLLTRVQAELKDDEA
jgi:ribosome-binding protein aMBF1 (putative translation factor)